MQFLEKEELRVNFVACAGVLTISLGESSHEYSLPGYYQEMQVKTKLDLIFLNHNACFWNSCCCINLSLATVGFVHLQKSPGEVEKRDILHSLTFA